MKRIKFMLLAITMLLAAPVFLTSCQEDAPEINYTINVSVINDFTKVVEAINNGTLRNEEAIAKLTEAIDKMNADQAAKLQAIIDVLNSVNATLETKLAAIEAAMKAQTLTLESKLALLETAIKNLPDYSAQLTAIKAVIESLPDYGDKLDALVDAIKALPDYSAQLEAIKAAIGALPDYGSKLTALENAIKALPNYNDKFDAVVDALNAMKTQVEALGTDQAAIATKIGEVTTAINNLIASVNSGNTSAAAALAQIIAKLEELKAAIGSGGGTPVVSNSLIIDGSTKSIVNVKIDQNDLADNNYCIQLLFGGSDEYVEVMADKANHDGKTIDLTKKETSHSGWYWAVMCKNIDRIFTTYGEPETSYSVFQSGTLYVKRLADDTDGKPVLEIKLEDGKVKDEKHGDGLEHTISLYYKGSMEKGDF